jgi:lysine 2,3-aminomutase
VFKIQTTPYYAELVRQSGPALARIVVPNSLEYDSNSSQQLLDPLAERKNNPTPRLVHRYSDRVLFLITDICSVYCRYCTRKHFTGKDEALARPADYESSLEYIRRHPGIREVILSGGDPLTLSNSHLDRILGDIRAIDHVEIIRIGSRMPVVCPMRLDVETAQMLRRHKPVYLMTHFNHPKELTAEAAQALENAVDHGLPVMNQMVLLNGVNNHPALVQALSRRLLFLRVKPYYMFQCDPSPGTDFLRTTVDQSLQIQRELWGHLSGLAMPTLSLDIPDGGGKVTLAPDYLVEKKAGVRHYRGWDGVRGEYHDPAIEMQVPADAGEYLREWEQLKSAKEIPQGELDLKMSNFQRNF